MVLLFSCKKDKDEVSPTITITAPYHLQQINGIDTVQVRATIRDDRNIKTVQVSLRNNNDIPVLSTVTKNPNTGNYDLNVFYYFDDVHLPSGQYYFDVSASDGENTTHAYVQILFNEANKIRRGIFLFSNNGSSTDIYNMDNTYAASMYHSITGDYLGAAVNSYDQQLIHASSVSGSISAISLNSGSVTWSEPIISSPPTPYYTGFLYHDQNCYLGERNGSIKLFSNNGVSGSYANTIGGYSMESGTIHDNTYFVVEEKQVSGSSVSLALYWLGSGVLAQQTSINEDVKGVYSLDANTISLLTNDASSLGRLVFYNVSSGLTSSTFTLGIGQIDDCAEITTGNYLVLHGGDITFVDANGFSTAQYLTGTGANRIWYDVVTNELLVAGGNTLEIYDYTSKTLKGSYTHSNTIQDVAFWYNK